MKPPINPASAPAADPDTQTLATRDARNPASPDPSRVTAAAFLGLVLAAALGGCVAPGADATAAASRQPVADRPESGTTEAHAPAARIVITHDGGLRVLDAVTLEESGRFDLEGFARINAAGDGRHVLVSTTQGFQVLDGGTWAEPHGDHAHYYTAAPALTPTVLDAEKPGHVVAHSGRTTLFDDGTGQVAAFGSADVADPDRAVRRHVTDAPHHGVAVELADGTLIVSDGTADGAHGIRVLDRDGHEIAATTDCPGTHGATVAADEAVVVGCTDGVLLIKDGEITKVASPHAYGRVGNQAGGAGTAVVLGDYKSDPDAEREHPTRVALVDTAHGTMALVDLPASYTFRSLARGDDGEALVLGTDGKIHVIDPVGATVTRSIPVIDPWEEPDQWQAPRPALVVVAGVAFVTDPAEPAIHAVDLDTGQVRDSVTLDVQPNEIEAVSGDLDLTPGHHEDADRASEGDHTHPEHESTH